MQEVWFSMETTRSRRSSKTFWNFGMKSCGPFSASTLAHCEIEVALVADWDCSFDNRGDQRNRAGTIADPPAGHGIGFRDAVHRQRALIEARFDLGDGMEAKSAKDQMLVHVVGEDPDMGIVHQHGREGLQLLTGVAGARGIGGLVQNDPFGPRRDGARKRLGRQAETRPPDGFRQRPDLAPASSTISG